MEAQQKRWLVAGGAAVVLAGGWFFFAGGDPETDLGSLNIEKRLRAIETLERQDTQKAAKSIAQYALKADTPEDLQVARRSLYAMGRMPKNGSTEVLVQALNHPKMEIREAAVAAMGARKEQADKPALRDRLLKDPAPEVRAAAAAELGAMRDWDSVALLVAALDDRNEMVVNNAMRGILDIAGREHAGFKPGATEAQRRDAINSLKRDWQSFKNAHDEYKRYREIVGR